MSRRHRVPPVALFATWLAVVSSMPLVAVAADATPTDMDPVVAKRAVDLAQKLRCLVCQNQTIADSNADLAGDLRKQIREQIAAGKTDDEIIAYMTQRYGDFVLYQPPFKATTALLWTGPALLLLAGFAVLLRHLRQRANDVPQLSPEDEARARQLLAEPTGPSEP
jgi:cytochrome c-type biogenesis protein CcmH